MATKLFHARPRRHPRVAPRWASEAARHLGYQPSTVEAKVHGRDPVHLQTARILEAAVRFGDPALVGKILAPIEAARCILPAPEFSRELVREVQIADLREDAAESAYLNDPTPENRRAWLKELREQRAKTDQLIRSLEAEEVADAGS